MLTDNDFLRIIEVINSHVDARKVIVFGSYATSEVKTDSDIDIMILVDDTVSSLREIVQHLHEEISSVLAIPCDILVEHETTFKERSGFPTIERTIAREGKILYAA